MKAPTTPKLSQQAFITGAMTRAQQLRQAGKPFDALSVLEQVHKIAPDFAPALALAGTICLNQGQPDRAVAFYRQCVAARPDHAETLHHLGKAEAAAGLWLEAERTHAAACRAAPRNAAFWHALGRAQLEVGKPVVALQSIDRTLELAPDSAPAYRNRGLAYEALGGREDKADQAYAKAAELKPDWWLPLANLAHLRRTRGDMAGLLAATAQWLDRTPRSVEALSLRGLALRELGREEEAAALFDFDRFVRVVDLDPPEGWASAQAFNAALAEHVTAHPTMAVPDPDHSTYHNDHLHITEELLAGEMGPMAALKPQLDQAVADYIDTVIRAPETRDHPFVTAFPDRYRLTAWATLLKGQGNLLPHIHLDGYLGGVYYPDLPDAIADGDGEAGWFELGRPPEDLGFTAATSVRRIQPKLGRLLLFPGYFYHGTVPFQSNQRRVSIAFDLVAEG